MVELSKSQDIVRRHHLRGAGRRLEADGGGEREHPAAVELTGVAVGRLGPRAAGAVRGDVAVIGGGFAALFDPGAAGGGRGAVVGDTEKATNVDLCEVREVTRLGDTIEDTQLFDELVFEQEASKGAGTAREPRSRASRWCSSRTRRPRRTWIIKKILKCKCNVLLIQKSILCDAVNKGGEPRPPDGGQAGIG